jgi:hypothetical protein
MLEAQAKKIEALEAELKTAPTSAAPAPAESPSITATLPAVLGGAEAALEAKAKRAGPIPQKQESLSKNPETTELQSGWNGEHFFLKSSDGSFSIQPYGYWQLDNRAYDGASTPTDTFAIRRGRFGFQGTLGKHYEFAFLADFADTHSTLVRDFYLNVKPASAIQFQFGQFKEPFAQELLNSGAYLDFVERSLASLLYPSPTTFRSPGALVHGDLIGGAVQYWVGAFNGKGTQNLNTTSTPEGVGRLRFSPWRNTSNEWLKGLAIGGAFARGQSGPNSNSFGALLPDGTLTFFKADPINGPVTRANGDFTWTKGLLALRGEYDQLNQFRRGLGARSTNLPGVVGKGYYATATYLLTGEKRPENGQAKPRHAFLMEEHGIGAWELKFRYANLQAAAGSQENRVDEFSSGINWYPNYFVRYMIDFNV